MSFIKYVDAFRGTRSCCGLQTSASEVTCNPLSTFSLHLLECQSHQGFPALIHFLLIFTFEMKVLVIPDFIACPLNSLDSQEEQVHGFVGIVSHPVPVQLYLLIFELNWSKR
jgi:hypothetical protein